MDSLEIGHFELDGGTDYLLLPSENLVKIWSLDQICSEIWSSIETIRSNKDQRNDKALNHYAAGNALNCLLSKSKAVNSKLGYSSILVFLSNLGNDEKK